MLGPLCIWLSRQHPRAGEVRREDLLNVLPFFGCMLVGPFLILIVLDWIGRRVIADRPSKFGPKVPTVGKWNS